MRRGLLLLGVCFAAAVITHVAGQASSSGSCGRERWSVKTGTDADAGHVNLTAVNATTIAYLTSQPYPGNIPSDGRVVPVETTKWQVDATLVEYKLEHDSDYHLVLTDGSRTMITEIPDPGCVDGSSPFRSAIAHARAQFDAHYSATDFFQNAGVRVRVSGVGFFDFYHGQTGAAPNQVELHPVLDVVFNPPPAAAGASPLTAPPVTPAPPSAPGAAAASPPPQSSSPTSSTSGLAIRAVLVILLLGAAGWFFLRRR
jgi:hypothetical protein